MAELLEKLGINWSLFIAQLVNFILLFLLVRRFLFLPLGKVLLQRQQDVVKLASDQEAVKEKELAAQSHYLTSVQQAKQEAQKIIQDATQASEKKSSQLLADTRLELARLQEQHQAQLAHEVEEARARLLQESVVIAINLAEKILRHELKDTASYQKALLQELETTVSAKL